MEKAWVQLGTRSVSDGPVYSVSHIARLEAERNRRRHIEWVEAYIRVGAGVTGSTSSSLVVRVRCRIVTQSASVGEVGVAVESSEAAAASTTRTLAHLCRLLM